MNQTLLGLPFSGKNDIVIHPKTRTLKLPHNTIQLTERIHKNGKISALTRKKNLFMKTHEPFTVKPIPTEIVLFFFNHVTFPDGTVAMVEPSPKFEKGRGLWITSAIVKLDNDNKVFIGLSMF